MHGVHLDRIEQLPISRMRVGLRGFREWACESWPGSESSFGSLASDGVLEIDLPGGKLSIEEVKRTQTKSFRTTVEHDLCAVFEFEQPKGLTEVMEDFIRPLHDLLVLATREEIRTTEITVLVPKEVELWWKDPITLTEEIRVVQRSALQWHAARPEPMRQIPLPLAAFGSDPAARIGQWFELRGKIGGAGNALFASLNRRIRTLEVELLTLLSAAEGYHRALLDEPAVSPKDHNEAVAKMIDVLPEEFKEHYAGRLKHADGQSQVQRIRALFERAAEAVPKLKGWKKTVRPLVQTRNLLTHWGEDSEEVLSIEDQLLALKKLEIVLRVNLMLDCGIAAAGITGSLLISDGEHRVFAEGSDVPA